MQTKAILAGLATLAFMAPQGQELKVGDKIPINKFNEVIWMWDGAESLGDYAGEPILVDFWGKN